MNKYKSNAKINIFLDVVSLLNNGYHNIRSIFCEISLYDIIKYKINKSSELRYFDFNKKYLDENNLVIKAGNLFSDYIKTPPVGIDFFLKKNIPIGGGLGGGSSNAASIIKILNKFWNKNYDTNKLKKLSKELGADVPFFINGGIQKVTGYGQITKKINTRSLKLFIVLIFPKLNISSKHAYQLIDKTDLSKENSINKNKFNNLLNAINKDNYKEIINNIYNKFEEVIFFEYPLLKKIYFNILDSNADKAFMSGSGSTMVGIYSTKNKMKNGINILKNLGYKVTQVKLLY